MLPISAALLKHLCCATLHTGNCTQIATAPGQTFPCSPKTAAANSPFKPKKAPAAATPNRPTPGTLNAKSSTSGMPPGASGRATNLTAGALKSRPLSNPASVKPATGGPPLLRVGGPAPAGARAGAACGLCARDRDGSVSVAVQCPHVNASPPVCRIPWLACCSAAAAWGHYLQHNPAEHVLVSAHHAGATQATDQLIYNC